MRDRHYFHWRHRRILAPLALVAGCASLWIVFTRVPAAARVPDSAVAAATLAYFSGIHSRGRLPSRLTHILSSLISRPVLIGVLFTAGCLLPVLSQTAGHDATGLPGRLLLVPAFYFAVLGWLNCHAIAQWESGPRAPSKPVQPISFLVASAGVLLALVLFSNQPRFSALVAAGAASALLLALLDRFRTRLTPLALRAGADLVLLTPFCLLIPRPFHL
jgi:hypothetical protein